MLPLSKLPCDVTARITGFIQNAPLEDTLRDIGFAEGDEVEVVHPQLKIGKRPITVRLNSTMIALRPEEASNILTDHTLKTSID